MELSDWKKKNKELLENLRQNINPQEYGLTVSPAPSKEETRCQSLPGGYKEAERKRKRKEGGTYEEVEGGVVTRDVKGKMEGFTDEKTGKSYYVTPSTPKRQKEKIELEAKKRKKYLEETTTVKPVTYKGEYHVVKVKQDKNVNVLKVTSPLGEEIKDERVIKRIAEGYKKAEGIEEVKVEGNKILVKTKRWKEGDAEYFYSLPSKTIIPFERKEIKRETITKKYKYKKTIPEGVSFPKRTLVVKEGTSPLAVAKAISGEKVEGVQEFKEVKNLGEEYFKAGYETGEKHSLLRGFTSTFLGGVAEIPEKIKRSITLYIAPQKGLLEEEYYTGVTVGSSRQPAYKVGQAIGVIGTSALLGTAGAVASGASVLASTGISVASGLTGFVAQEKSSEYIYEKTGNPLYATIGGLVIGTAVGIATGVGLSRAYQVGRVTYKEAGFLERDIAKGRVKVIDVSKHKVAQEVRPMNIQGEEYTDVLIRGAGKGKAILKGSTLHPFINKEMINYNVEYAGMYKVTGATKGGVYKYIAELKKGKAVFKVGKKNIVSDIPETIYGYAKGNNKVVKGLSLASKELMAEKLVKVGEVSKNIQLYKGTFATSRHRIGKVDLAYITREGITISTTPKPPAEGIDKTLLDLYKGYSSSNAGYRYNLFQQGQLQELGLKVAKDLGVERIVKQGARAHVEIKYTFIPAIREIGGKQATSSTKTIKERTYKIVIPKRSEKKEKGKTILKIPEIIPLKETKKVKRGIKISPPSAPKEKPSITISKELKNMVESKVSESSKVLPEIKVDALQKQLMKEKGKERSRTKTKTSISTTSLTIPPFSPFPHGIKPVPPLFKPPEGSIIRGRRTRKLFSEGRRKYEPSLFAVAKKIVGKMSIKQVKTGLELRPLNLGFKLKRRTRKTRKRKKKLWGLL